MISTEVMTIIKADLNDTFIAKIRYILLFELNGRRATANISAK